MDKTKCLGIWLDHSKANLIDFSNESNENGNGTGFQSQFNDTIDDHSMNRGENKMHNKEQDGLSKYYKNITEVISNYDEVLLFGPTDAKHELFNLLKANPHFSKINIEVKPADKMTEPEQNAFVKEYFSKN